MALLNQEQIKEIIPHRDPFLLIDEVVEMEPGVRVVAKKYLKPDEFWFKGHFPQEPVQPGVLTVEMLAQAGAVCALSLPENKGKIAYFAGIDKAKSAKKWFRAIRSHSKWRSSKHAAASVSAKQPLRLTENAQSPVKSRLPSARDAGELPCLIKF